ncbi:MAG TPA: DUF5667 domain-containing protein [Candidatus Limnocylindrales bacterium]|nr:DUF5667 domain-containing protein [Candidatus Limnocylindrales bacterium]
MSVDHAALDQLVPYADEALSLTDRAAVAEHVGGCPSCALELRRLQQLNAVLEGFPPAPPSNFAAFWMRLRARLPVPAPARPAFPVRRRAALAFALAAVAALAVGTTAFAAGTALPDSPLYPVKLGEEELQLAVTFAPQARLQAEIEIANERLREARAMAGIGKSRLADQSLRDFRRLLAQITPELNQAERASFQLQLTALQQVTALHRPEPRGLVATGAHLLGLSGERPDDATNQAVAQAGQTPTSTGTATATGTGDHHGGGSGGSGGDVGGDRGGGNHGGGKPGGH